MNVMAIDWGSTTGFCKIDHDGEIESFGHFDFDSDIIATSISTWQRTDSVVACEDWFVPRARNGEKTIGTKGLKSMADRALLVPHLCIAYRVRFVLLQPSTWKKAMGAKTKADSVFLAQQELVGWPLSSRKKAKNHNCADAINMARYVWLTHRAGFGK